MTVQLSGKPKKKRLNHNELERKRRHHQREILYELRDVIPNLHMVKPSTVLIMQKSKDYIDLLRRTIQEMEIEINDLRRALVAAGYPLPMAPHQQVMCGFPGGQTVFNSSCQSPRLLPEQMLNMSPQSHLQIDHQNQLAFQSLGDIALARAQFDTHDIDSINHLHSVLSKATSELNSATGRPISPVSPYQLDQMQGCSSGEFKSQSHIILTAASVAAASGQSVL
ncbi:hypothetical protein LPJ66_003183 [Kickxella alabastrina]|uniref:Uncharacterized protein n=1 Tax=Kickxella alabastrina TaxID=61397 RepID=A0ACC1INW8_9FUNG|nr:hypothetical protein LPJ66_003183 [Kickxella alabastrina]